MQSLAGKVAIVTGASTGMGQAIGAALAEAGAALALMTRNPERLDSAAALVRRRGGDVLTCPGDVAYSASKHGIQSLTGSINAEERRHGIRATQPDHVSVDLWVINPTVRRNYQADSERYVAEGHTDAPLD